MDPFQLGHQDPGSKNHEKCLQNHKNYKNILYFFSKNMFNGRKYSLHEKQTNKFFEKYIFDKKKT